MTGGVKVIIKRAGMYSDFSTWPKVGAKHCEEGEVVRFPAEYANSIVASGLAEEYVEPAPKAEPKPKTRRRKKA